MDEVQVNLKEQEAQAKKEASDLAKQQRKEATLLRKEQKAAAKQAAKEARLEGKQARLDAKQAAKEEKAANRQPMQNGVRRPGPGLCRRVWDLATQMSDELGQPVAAADLIKAGEYEGLVVTNIRCEFAAWKKFHGIKGKIGRPKNPNKVAVNTVEAIEVQEQ